MPVRLNKFLSECGVCSRRQADALIQQGKVHINGRVVTTLGTQVDPDNDQVKIGSRLIKRASPVLYAFHKPRGVTTTLSDPHAKKTLADFVQDLPERVFPIGRLDRDVSGLLLVTSDGDFAEKISHPRYEVRRHYWAIVSGAVQESALRKLRAGVRLEDGVGIAVRAGVLSENSKTRKLLRPLRADESLISLVVASGRKHFVKRMFIAVGHPVECLSRVEFGPYALGDLEVGKFRKLSLKKFDYQVPQKAAASD